MDSGKTIISDSMSREQEINNLTDENQQAKESLKANEEVLIEEESDNENEKIPRLDDDLDWL